MRKLLFINILILFFVCSVCLAETEEYGPVPNYKGMKDVTSSVIIPSVVEMYFIAPFTGEEYKIGGFGGGEFEFTSPTPVFVDSYVYIDKPTGVPFDPEIDDILLTEIYAYDLEPGLDANHVPPQKGFHPDPCLTEMIPLGQAFFEGLSGTLHSASITTIPVADLHTALPDYDTYMIMDDPPGSVVHVMQGWVPASDFVVQPFDFTYEHLGFFEQSDPAWVGPKDPNFPFQHFWELDIQEWGDVEYVSDVHVEQPWHVIPGYIQVVPPSNWVNDGVTVGRYGYQANEGAEITAGGGSLGIEWRVNAKIPQVVPGHVILTKNSLPTSRYMPTMVPAADDEFCGDWGYLPGDFDEDCDEDGYDLAYFAADWLKSTDPTNPDATLQTIVGVGFAFDDDDTAGPVVVGHIHDNTTCAGLLEVGDIIVEYRSIPVSCGAHLRDVINALPDVPVGQPVPMKVLKQGTGYGVYIDPVAQELPVVAERTSSSGKDCAEGWITPTGEKTCHCVTGSHICACGWQAKKDKNGKIMKIKTHCADTGGNVCHGDWVSVK